MRTNIDIDERTLESAMKSGAYKTKKDAVDAGLKLLARQIAHREILRWEGKLRWDDEVEAGSGPALATASTSKSRAVVAAEPLARRRKSPAHGRR